MLPTFLVGVSPLHTPVHSPVVQAAHLTDEAIHMLCSVPPAPPLRKHHEVRPGPGAWTRRCLRDVQYHPSQEEQHRSWLKITSTQTAVGCSSKHNVVVSRRTHPKHDTAPVFLYDRHTITFCEVSDHKNCGQTNDGQTGSRCFTIIRRWPSPPVSHRQEITVRMFGSRVPVLRQGGASEKGGRGGKTVSVIVSAAEASPCRTDCWRWCRTFLNHTWTLKDIDLLT